jgi:hypothetical protein
MNAIHAYNPILFTPKLLQTFWRRMDFVGIRKMANPLTKNSAIAHCQAIKTSNHPSKTTCEESGLPKVSVRFAILSPIGR